MTAISLIYHDLCLRGEELVCCGSRPGSQRIDKAQVELYVKVSDWHGGQRRELMARHNGVEREIDMCQNCVEAILCHYLYAEQIRAQPQCDNDCPACEYGDH